MDHIEEAPPDALVTPIDEPPLRFVTSATELMTRARNERDWRLKYRHGIIPPGRFAPRDAGDVPAVVRGTLIHGVLERIEEEEELAALLDETIGALDAPELEVAMAPGSRYRAALEEEIRRVLKGEEWRWYVEGEHYRELAFVHLAGDRSWRVGKFDLYRPDEPEARIVDFKTHQIGPEEVEEKAQDYAVQSEVYTAAAEVRGPARMELHFTHPNVVIELPPEPDADTESRS
jgi:ATP-dependent exoDNAse (exonuclease V) beta subunit